MTNNYNENTNPDYLNNEATTNQNNVNLQTEYPSSELSVNQSTGYQNNESITNQNAETLHSGYQSNEPVANLNNEQTIETKNVEEQINVPNNHINNFNNYNRNVDFSLPTTFEDYVKLSENFYAGFWQRFMAYIIDLIVVAAITGLFNTITMNYMNVSIKLSLIGEYTISFLIVSFAYFILMTYYFSQTLGKIIMKIKVETNKGEKLSWYDVIYRELVGRILTTVLFYIPYVFVGILPKKKGLHDYIADTVVVKEDFSKLRKQMNEKIRAL